MNNKNTCNICNTDFKYHSLLKRHIEKKKSCIKPSINDNKTTTEAKNNNLIIGDKINDIKDIIKQNLCYTDILLLFSSIIDEKQKTNNDINNDIDTNDTINIKIYNCKNCNCNFASGSSLCNHNKLGRCKGNDNIKEQDNITIKSINNSGTTLNDILEININNDNSITNNITNITNNITININPFGCENLDNITVKQFTSIFKNFKHLNKMLYELGNMVYKDINNMNFTKNNMNKNIVTYLDRDMEVKQISEREFIKDFEANIKKLCIELFHIHKNDISLDNLIEYMQSFLLFYDILNEKKNNHIEIKEQLKSIMDYVFRDENINELIRKIKIDLQNNKELKEQCKNNIIIRETVENKRLNEYYIAPTKDNKDKKNLYIVKELSFEKNTKDRKNILEKSIATKYSKKLENLEIQNAIKEEEIKKPIIIKFNNETGEIIDDRE
jgi:hypothetical protein